MSLFARRRRHQAPTPDPSHGLRQEYLRIEAENERFREGIDKRVVEHKPYANENDLRPGFASPEIRFWCSRCQSPWPCRAMQALRTLYAEATEWDEAGRAYDPLTLRWAEKDEAADE